MNVRKYGFTALMACAVFAACSDENEPGIDPVPGGEEETTEVYSYIVAGTGSGQSGDQAAYVLPVSSFDSGDNSIKGNGYETTYASYATWLFYGNKYLYRLAYNRGQAGTTVAFYLDKDGKVKQRSGEYNILNFTSHGIFGNKIITSATAASDQKDEHGNAAYAINFSVLNVDDETAGTRTLLAEGFLGGDNKEYVMLSGFEEINGKLYTAVIPMGCSPYGVAAGGVLPGNEDLIKNAEGGTGGGTYTSGTLTGTQYPDECWIAVFNDDTFTDYTLIHTDQLSYATGRMRSQYYQTFWAADNGDIYVFSPSFAKSQSDPRQQTRHNSGVMRIKSGATEFDAAYGMVDIESVAGCPIYRCWHISADYFLLQMYANGFSATGQGTTKLAIYKGEDKSFRFVSGLPAEDDISSFSTKAPYCEDGICYVGVSTISGKNPIIYKIDPATATATAGNSIQIDEIGGLGMLKAE